MLDGVVSGGISGVAITSEFNTDITVHFRSWKEQYCNITQLTTEDRSSHGASSNPPLLYRTRQNDQCRLRR